MAADATGDGPGSTSPGSAPWSVTSASGDAGKTGAGLARAAADPSYCLRPPDTAAEWAAYHLIRRDVFLESGEERFRRADEDEDRLPGHFPLLLMASDQPVGTIRVDLLESGRAALRLVAIHPSCQAKGHGAHLLQQAEAFARRMGCKAAVVYSTLEAAGFYARAGYVEDPWDDCCIGGIVQMTKPL